MFRSRSPTTYIIAGTKLKSPILGPTKGLAQKKVFRWEFPETRTISLKPRRCSALSRESECYGEWLSLQPRAAAPVLRNVLPCSTDPDPPSSDSTRHCALSRGDTTPITYSLHYRHYLATYHYIILTLSTGIYCWSWYFQWFLYWRLHFMHLYKTDRTVFLPHNIDNFSLKVIIEIWVPACQFINCSSIHLSTAGWFLY